MSLDLVKNALYAAIKIAIPTLVVYPEVLDFAPESYPNLTFILVDTQHLEARAYYETITIPGPPDYSVPVIAWANSKMRLQLRNTLAQGDRTAATYQAIRDQHNAVHRMLVKTRSVACGPSGQTTLAEIWFKGFRQAYDKGAGVFLSEFEIDINPWRLLDSGPGVITYYANTISVDIDQGRSSNENQILITRTYPLT